MKYPVLFIAFVLSLAIACKSKSSATATDPKAMAVPAKTKGKVSHQYRSSGCATVIVLNEQDKPASLIPKDKLPAEFDVDGMEIVFNYRVLKMPQPQGCTTGVPAEIKDISKK